MFTKLTIPSMKYYFDYQAHDMTLMKQYYDPTRMENQPYPCYMVVNRFATESIDHNIWIPNRQRRVPVIPIPEPPKKQTTTPAKGKYYEL